MGAYPSDVHLRFPTLACRPPSPNTAALSPTSGTTRTVDIKALSSDESETSTFLAE